MKALIPGLFLVLLTGCAGMPHGDANPPQGYGGYAEWRWPYRATGDSWAEQMNHPDKVPNEFRTAQVRLKHMREGCAWLLFPAYVSVAERQYNKALRAFAAEYYEDSFVDLRALNNQLDEIDRRLEIAGADHGCLDQRNRHHNGHYQSTCTGHGDCGGHGLDCGHPGEEFNCASGPDELRKPGCGKVKPCQSGAHKVHAKPCNDGLCPWSKKQRTHDAHRQHHGQIPNGFQLPDNLFLKAQFPYNSDQVLPEYHGYLEQFAVQLKQRANPRILIQGHASAEGSESYNRELANRRAQRVANILAGLGVPRQLMNMASFGEMQPTDSNSTEQGRAANRRVEIYLQTPVPLQAQPAQ
ncbi:MAG: OmpA family protein [Oceanococcus sp.]